ncbi:MAG: hypothetical protein AAFX05_13635 [Planctomycetota bacterium]
MRHAALSWCALGVCTLAVAAQGAMIEYTLIDHEDGSADPPGYGLRMDDSLAGLGGVGGTTTFSFDAAFFDAGRDDVTLTIDTIGGTLTIEGEVYGGEDAGATYGFGEGWYDLFFQYSVGLTPVADGWIITPGDPTMNSGTLTSQGNADVVAGVVVNIYDTTGSETFILREDGHRLSGDNSTRVGRGWNSLDPTGTSAPGGSFRDWLFIAIPAPAGSAVLAMAAVGIAIRRRG